MSASVHGVTLHPTIAITVNGSRATNVNAAVIYRIYVSVFYEASFISG